jgi:hypothetical protein
VNNGGQTGTFIIVVHVLQKTIDNKLIRRWKEGIDEVIKEIEWKGRESKAIQQAF